MTYEYEPAYSNAVRYCWAIRTPTDDAHKPLWGPGFFGRKRTDYSLDPIRAYAIFDTRAKAEAYLRDYVIPHRQGKRDCRVVRVCVRESLHEVEYFPRLRGEWVQRSWSKYPDRWRR